MDRIDAGSPTAVRTDHLEGRTVAGALILATDARLEAAQLEFEHAQVLSPESELWW